MNIGWSKYCKRPYSRNETAKGEKKKKKEAATCISIEIENYVYDLHFDLKKNIWIVVKYGHK